MEGRKLRKGGREGKEGEEGGAQEREREGRKEERGAQGREGKKGEEGGGEERGREVGWRVGGFGVGRGREEGGGGGGGTVQQREKEGNDPGNVPPTLMTLDVS